MLVSTNNSERFIEPCVFEPAVVNVLDAISESGRQNTSAFAKHHWQHLGQRMPPGMKSTTTSRN